MARDNDYEPGTPAPVAGSYQELNIFGAPTGAAVYSAKGALLPRLPRGFRWRFVARPLISEMSAADLLARAADFQRMAATAATAETRDALLRIAKRFKDAADRATGVT